MRRTLARARFASSGFAVRQQRSAYFKPLAAVGAAVGGISGGLWWLSLTYDARIRDIDDDGLPRTYVPEEMETYWDAHPLIAVGRFFAIAKRIVPFAANLLASYYFTNDLESKEGKAACAVEFRHLLTDLGPCFIKFGQMLSIRPDVLPPVAVLELQKLCDSVPPYPTRIAIQMIERELGLESINDMFEGIEEATVPIAAASLGQVYKVKFRGGDDKWVALKVQRPDMIRSVSLDLYLLRKYAHGVEFAKRMLTSAGLLTPRKSYDLNLLDTFATASYLELDYVQEAKNQERISKLLIPRIGCDKVHVPRVFWHATSRKVLASEFIQGVQLAKSDADTIRSLIPVGVKVYLTQLLDIGFFHSDPHPGNLLVDQSGRLVLIDFGLCANVAKIDTRGMTSAIVHLMTGNVKGLLDDAIDLGFLPRDVDQEALLPVLQRVYEDAALKEKSEASLSAASYRSVERRKQFAGVSNELNEIFFKFPFTVPPYFALITRALITLEGIALTGDREFDIFQASYPYCKARAVDVFGWRDAARIATAAAEFAHR